VGCTVNQGILKHFFYAKINPAQPGDFRFIVKVGWSNQFITCPASPTRPFHVSHRSHASHLVLHFHD
jgi:hypothetical protein